MIKIVVFSICFFMFGQYYAQNKVYTKYDTLFGSNSVYRDWWNVLHYDITVTPNFKTKSIRGIQKLTFSVIEERKSYEMQIDLQEPLLIDSIFFENKKVSKWRTSKNMYFIGFDKLLKGSINALQIYYHGKPREATNPPWDGGWVWKKDSLGNPWMSVACQGDGASIWYPCKDLQSEEPDNGAMLSIIVPDTLIGIGNGKLKNITKLNDGLTQYTWEVTNTINSYDIVPYIGKYTCLKDSVVGLKGTLYTDYWVLNYHVNKAKQYLKSNVVKTIACLENWFGPYPFYNDTYKIVESPYLGMEHQSNIAYGNKYINGYLGSDLSGTGWGLKWDFIVVHESAHEWFGNSITAKDVADNWIHEGFASYAEVLFTECGYGKLAGDSYCQGVRRGILNDVPVIGTYDLRQEGSGDMYNKASQVIHMIRQLINNDETFRLVLNKISEKFYHKEVSTQEFEEFLIAETKLNLKPIFDQYLRTTKVPILEYKFKGKNLMYRYTNCNADFTMPVKISAGQTYEIVPTTKWQTILVKKALKNIELDKNMYVRLQRAR